MANQSSRAAALERRKALTDGGKKAVGRYSSGASRVRSASDARPTRTQMPEPVVKPAPAVQEPSRSQARTADQRSFSSASSTPVRRSQPVRVSNPSRELVLARRQALSRAGKRASTSRDRTRADLPRREAEAVKASTAPVVTPCQCRKGPGEGPVEPRLTPPLASGRSAPAAAASRNGRGKASSQHNPSRALVLARREALSKHGKSASASAKSGAAVARQINPEISGRELARKVRELKSRSGSAGTSRSAGTRPCGPNRHGARQAAAADASWKVGVSETLSGQTVTGTQANRSAKTTGNESSTCRTITGTEYLGAEVFQTFCGGKPSQPAQPPKVRLSSTSHGNRVTGNEVGRSEKVTGDEPGTCKSITGTEYVSANQSAGYCGSVTPSPRKVGQSQTLGGQPVSGVMVGRSSRVTGDEPGSGLQLTGDQYLGSEPAVPGRSPEKVVPQNTLRGVGVTGTAVGRSDLVTGDEPGSCRLVTGDEYIGSQQYASFCASKPAPEPRKVGFSITHRTQVVSGTQTGRSGRVTGDEPGTCKAVTGTPYAGLEQAGDFCPGDRVSEIRSRTPVRGASRMSGIQPGIGGHLTGAERGACEAITGTPYVGKDQLAEACTAASDQDADYPQPLAGSQPWQQFSIQSPARAAQVSRERGSAVTGTTYEQGRRITGPFNMAADKVTGTEQFRFDRSGRQLARGPLEPSTVASTDPAGRVPSRVTGEGISAGLKITGDDWDRGDHVTGTEGVSARRRNPSRPGPATAMPSFQRKRNDEVPEPVSRVTGSSGNTASGSLITVSGGARG
ncbi:MAG: CsoS2 family carboxysome shell protein [Cyanobacteriota bacterium]|nr:CsoS2 family carboxysome shell protein [Cyanobacteriota bacterium]